MDDDDETRKNLDRLIKMTEVIATNRERSACMQMVSGLVVTGMTGDQAKRAIYLAIAGRSAGQ